MVRAKKFVYFLSRDNYVKVISPDKFDCKKKESRLSYEGFSDTNLILSIALEGLKSIYKANIKYVKCGVILSGLVDENRIQDYLWPTKTIGHSQLSQAIDAINIKFDKHSIRLATQSNNPIWGMKQSKKSQSFTTSWNELLVVN